ncbi:hypothetical protein F5888DRAFT_792560 [Russula emetica]|nr:hypothetical protein F5888DRAFT_792560 [Russula emetica]
MLSKSFTASILLLALTSSVNAQCVFSPPFGGSGNPAASDVQQPSSDTPCGKTSISQNIDTSSAVNADADGQFTISAINFASGEEGSRLIQTGKVDPSGAGDNFQDIQIITNGNNDPSSEATQQLTLKLPSGIKCVGGNEKNRCLASFVTPKGYGNCVVVIQPGTTAQNPTSTNGGKTPTSTQNNDQTKANQKTGGDNKHKKRMMRKRRL